MTESADLSGAESLTTTTPRGGYPPRHLRPNAGQKGRPQAPRQARCLLYRIARNAIIDFYRKRKPTVDIPEGLAVPENTPGEQARLELKGCLLPMIRWLPAHARKAVLISEIEGRKVREVNRSAGHFPLLPKFRVQRGRTLLKGMHFECCRFEYDHRGVVTDSNPSAADARLDDRNTEPPSSSAAVRPSPTDRGSRADSSPFDV